MLLPKSREDHAQAIVDTKTELLRLFGGVTAYVRSPATGAWAGTEGVEQDDVVMVEVVVKEFDRKWWSRYSRTLAGRFEQKEIHIRALQVDLL